MHCLLIMPDGVGVRNFVFGGFLSRLARNEGGATAFHVIPEDLLVDIAASVDGPISWHKLITYRQPALAKVLLNSLLYAHMFWADTQSMRFIRNWPLKGSRKRRALLRTTKAIGRLTASRAGIRLLDAGHCMLVSRMPEMQEYRKMLEEIRPSIVFCSHQRPPDILPPVLAAKSLGIPTATFIFSWDNLSSKGRIAAPFDHYLVWSEHMRQELLRYYPDIAPDRVHTVGTPQFDCYSDTSLLWSREEFFQRLGADASRKLICYSGGDTTTCPEDHKHVRILMQLIRSEEIAGNPQVLVRPTPVDEGSRYEEVRRDFPELLYARPAWVHATPGDWLRVTPLAEDMQVLANLTHHADVNVNLGSTMTLDFAVHDKPVVNVAFDIADPPPFGRPVWEFFYRFEHYRPVVELGAARFARSPKELAEHINAYLSDPTLDRESRRRLVDLELGVEIGQSSERTIQVLRMIAQKSAVARCG